MRMYHGKARNKSTWRELMDLALDFVLSLVIVLTLGWMLIKLLMQYFGVLP